MFTPQTPQLVRVPTYLSLTYLAHASFRATLEDGRVVLFDPWLTGNKFLPASEANQPRADIVLISHGHFDHFDSNIVKLLKSWKAKCIAVNELAGLIDHWGYDDVEAMNIGGSIDLGGIEIKLTQAVHSNRVSDSSGWSIFAGLAVGFVVTFRNDHLGDFRLYHAGDTDLFGDMRLIGQDTIDLALLPIGGHSTMGPRDAARASWLLNAKAVVPMHYGTFDFLPGTLAQFRDECRRYSTVPIIEMKAGDTLSARGLHGARA